MLIPRMRTPAEMAEIMKRQETIRPLPYAQFGSAAPAFWPETDEPVLEPHQTYYTASWAEEATARSAAALPVHTAIGSPIEWSWVEELERRSAAMRPYGRQELGLAVEQEGYVAVPRRYVTELGRTDVPRVHEYTAVPRRYVTGLGAPAVPPRHGYVAMPRRLVTGLGQPEMLYSPDLTTEAAFREGAASVNAEADRREYDLLLGGLNAANIFSEGQITLPAMTELVRGAVLYVARYKGTKKWRDLSKTALEERTYIAAADFNEKVRWGIAFVRFFLANPDRYGLAVRDASYGTNRPVAHPSYWWAYENFRGLSNYVPAVWW